MKLFRFFAMTMCFFVSVLMHAELKWITPTPAELSMTAEPKAPGAPAIVLSYEETDDANTFETIIHARIKILTLGGLSAGNIELPRRLVDSDYFDQNIFARTIHPNGTIIPFVRSTQNTANTQDDASSNTVISLPSVEVGSILEYIFHFEVRFMYTEQLLSSYAPVWNAQRKYFMRSAHFRLNAPNNLDSESVRWVATLPDGISPQRNRNHVDLTVTDVPAVPSEEFMPPESSVRYAVRFFYFDGTRDKYWSQSADRVDDVWMPFYKPRPAIVAAVKGLIQPTDTDEQKLRKIYAAVQHLVNTDYSRQRTRDEDRQAGFRDPQNSEDIWKSKRGDSQQLAFLVIALARAAGFTANPMAVTSRDRAAFDQNVLSWAQMDSTLAIVVLNGHEVYLDPGTPLCPFGYLAPQHTNVIGISIEGKLVKTHYTPAQPAAASLTDRRATLQLSANGTVTGAIKITFTGSAGLNLRADSISEDQAAVETSLEKNMQASVPPGVQLKLASLTGLSNPDSPIVASFTVSGTLGTTTKTRLVFSEQFFQANAKALLPSSTRSFPIAFPGAYGVRDVVAIQIPSGFRLEAQPAPQSLSLKSDIFYKTSIQIMTQATSTQSQSPPFLVIQRVFALSRLDYPATEYPALHAYFGEIAAHDQEQMILHTTAPAATGN